MMTPKLNDCGQKEGYTCPSIKTCDFLVESGIAASGDKEMVLENFSDPYEW